MDHPKYEFDVELSQMKKLVRRAFKWNMYKFVRLYYAWVEHGFWLLQCKACQKKYLPMKFSYAQATTFHNLILILQTKGRPHVVIPVMFGFTKIISRHRLIKATCLVAAAAVALVVLSGIGCAVLRGGR